MTALTHEQRVLGAVRFVDGTTRQPVSRELTVTAEGVRWLRNRRGIYVAAEAPGLGSHAAAFSAPPTEPALASVTVTISISDPAGSYLPRRAVLGLPRDPSPGAAESASLFVPVDVTLYPAPAARVFPNWALVRVAVADADTGAPLAGALLRVIRNGDAEAEQERHRPRGPVLRAPGGPGGGAGDPGHHLGGRRGRGRE